MFVKVCQYIHEYFIKEYVPSFMSEFDRIGIRSLGLSPFGCLMRWSFKYRSILKNNYPLLNLPTLVANLLGILLFSITLIYDQHSSWSHLE